MLHASSFRRLTGLFLAAGASLAFSAPASAAEVIGELSAQIDGKPYHGTALYLPSEGTATAELRKFGPSVIVSVQVLDPNADRLLDNSFQLEFSGGPQGSALADASASWYPEGMRGPFYAADAEGGKAEVQVEHIQLDGDARVSGTFTAEMCRKESFFTEMDLSQCIQTEGSFETALRPG